MHRGLPLVVSIGVVSFNSTKLEFGTLVNSTLLASAFEKFPSGSGMSSYVPSASEVVSICNAVVEN